jgi:hypothetical protein
MVLSISLRWKVFGVSSRPCSKPHVIQPIVSKPLPQSSEGDPRYKGERQWSEEAGRKTWIWDKRLEEKSTHFLGEGVERKDFSFLQMVPVPVLT